MNISRNIYSKNKRKQTDTPHNLRHLPNVYVIVIPFIHPYLTITHNRCYFLFLKDGNIGLHYHILFLSMFISSLNFISHTKKNSKNTFFCLAFWKHIFVIIYSLRLQSTRYIIMRVYNRAIRMWVNGHKEVIMFLFEQRKAITATQLYICDTWLFSSIVSRRCFIWRIFGNLLFYSFSCLRINFLCMNWQIINWF